MRTWTVTIVHEGVHPDDTDDVRVIRSREKVSAETDSEAVVVALLRTSVDRASMATRITGIEVG